MKTPMSSDTKLTKDEECESVDSTKYRGMIGSLLYLTASRPDIMFSVCLCARFQEAPKTSHLEAVKRIFRYIKGTTHLRLWYPKGTGIKTVVYADSDHAGDYKQTALAISTTEAGYVSAGKACQQALWMKQALIDYDVTMPRATSLDHQKTRNYIPLISNEFNQPLLNTMANLEKCVPSRGLYKTKPPSSRVIKTLIQVPRQGQETRTKNKKTIVVGKKRPRESNSSSSSSTLNHPSSSHPLDDSIDENDDESFHSNPSSPSQNISSSSNDVSKVHQNPPHESHYLNTYLSETINLQTQQRDAHREGLRSIGQALKNMMGGKRK
ncbi:hypothetical protein Tco_0040976 [Tanacetum coccineum]